MLKKLMLPCALLFLFFAFAACSSEQDKAAPLTADNTEAAIQSVMPQNGTCFFLNNCQNPMVGQFTADACIKDGGKSWNPTGTNQCVIDLAQ